MYSALAKHPVRVSRYTGYIDIRHGSRAVCRAAPDTTSQASVSLWDGSDAFSDLDDRLDKVPLTLPSIKAKKRIVVVRHGQSTWNAEGRIQVGVFCKPCPKRFACLLLRLRAVVLCTGFTASDPAQTTVG